jgi:hypothetical protein
MIRIFFVSPGSKEKKYPVNPVNPVKKKENIIESIH